MKQKTWFRNGAIIPFWEYNPTDLIKPEQMYPYTPKKLINMVYDQKGFGHNYKRGMTLLSLLIVREFLGFIVDRCIEHTDRFIFPDLWKTKMFVGLVPHDPNRWVKEWKRNMMNFHSRRKRYGLIFKMEKAIYPYHYYIRMQKEKRINLARRIFKGQQYHDC